MIFRNISLYHHYFSDPLWPSRPLLCRLLDMRTRARPSPGGATRARHCTGAHLLRGQTSVRALLLWGSDKREVLGAADAAGQGEDELFEMVGCVSGLSLSKGDWKNGNKNN